MKPKAFIQNPYLRNGLIAFLAKYIASNPNLKNFILQSRASRLRHTESTNPFAKIGSFITRTLLEIIPYFGDAISIIEGLIGKELLGRKLDAIDRLISLAAGLIPFVPATPFRELVRSIRIELEEATLKYSEV